MENVFFQTFIDIEKWNQAQWWATAFFHVANGSKPPYFGIVFRDIELGNRIFADWRQRIGPIDEFNELRIAIVEGEILGKQPGYAVHISSDPEHTAERARREGQKLEWDISAVVGRVNRMTPVPGSPHLPLFKDDFEKHKRYFVIPVSEDLKPQIEYAIGKTEIHFRDSSGINKEDVDSVVFPANYFDRDDTIQ